MKPDVQLSSISGGTDSISCFALGNPLLPVYRGELQCRGLGMKVEIFDDEGRSLRGAERRARLHGAVSLDAGRLLERSRRAASIGAAYFERFPSVWCHGDYAELTEHGGARDLRPLGRGAESRRRADRHGRDLSQCRAAREIAESVAVGQDWARRRARRAVRALQPGLKLDEALENRSRRDPRRTPRRGTCPAKILAVADIPRTMNGKIAELAVRDVIHGRDVVNVDALANPDALDHFRDRVELAE